MISQVLCYSTSYAEESYEASSLLFYISLLPYATFVAMKCPSNLRIGVICHHFRLTIYRVINSRCQPLGFIKL